MKAVFALAAFACLPAPPASAVQQGGLLDPAVRDLLHEELSGELAKDHVLAITRWHRIQASREYRESAEYVLAQLREYGFGEDEAWIEAFPSDGKVVYQTWQSPSGWDVEAAELRMVEPYAERIVGYPEIAMSLITYSNAGEATAELVWVGRGTRPEDYAGKDVAGKFVLATGYGGAVHRLAVLEHGAVGVVCYLDDERAKEHPDMLQYTGMWPKTDELERTTFGFNLTNRQGEKLRGLLERGQRVVLEGWVRGTGLEPFHMDVVIASIPGAEHPEQEIVFTAHLDHPKESANDNASGSAAILDVARGLSALIRDKRLPPPRRTLRFLWVPEWNGTMAYLDAHEEMAGPPLGGKWLANLNMDMVGEDLEQLHSKLILTRTPDSVPSVLNEVIADMAAMVDGVDVRTPRGSRSAFNYRQTPYSGGSDHMMFLDRKIPAVMFSHSPDYTHHTSEDTPDKVDPVQLERCELLAAGAAWFLANLNDEEAVDLAQLCGANAARRLALAGRAAQAHLMEAEPAGRERAWAESQNLLDRALERELAAVGTIRWFRDTEPVRHWVELVQDQLARQYRFPMLWMRSTVYEWGIQDELPPPLHELPDARVPVRLTRGPLDFGLPESGLPSDRVAWYRDGGAGLSGTVRFELVNFIDGRRTVDQIRDALSAEFEPLNVKTVARYLDDLETVGAIQWR